MAALTAQDKAANVRTLQGLCGPDDAYEWASDSWTAFLRPSTVIPRGRPTPEGALLWLMLPSTNTAPHEYSRATLQAFAGAVRWPCATCHDGEIAQACPTCKGKSAGFEQICMTCGGSGDYCDKCNDAFEHLSPRCGWIGELLIDLVRLARLLDCFECDTVFLRMDSRVLRIDGGGCIGAITRSSPRDHDATAPRLWEAL